MARNLTDMKLLSRAELDHITPERLWAKLDHDTRLRAARAIYDPGHDDAEGRLEADGALAAALRSRPVAVRKMPVEKRADWLARLAGLDGSLICSLLLALHLVYRRPMLAAFLDHLGIRHDDGFIRDRKEVSPPGPRALGEAARALLGDGFPEDEVEVYLASLLAMDAQTWGGVAGIEPQTGSGAGGAPGSGPAD